MQSGKPKIVKETAINIARQLLPGIFSLAWMLFLMPTISGSDLGIKVQNCQVSHNTASTEAKQSDVTLNRLLLQATERGDLVAVRSLVAQGTDVNATQTNGWTALMLAVQNTHASIVEYLLAHGADVHRRSTLYNDTDAMLLAAESGNLSICLMLLAHGGNINEIDIDGDTPLMHAVSNGNLSPKQVYQVTKLPIKHGANVNVSDKIGNTALSLAQDRPPILGRLTKTLPLLSTAKENRKRKQATPKI